MQSKTKHQWFPECHPRPGFSTSQAPGKSWATPTTSLAAKPTPWPRSVPSRPRPREPGTAWCWLETACPLPKRFNLRARPGGRGRRFDALAPAPGTGGHRRMAAARPRANRHPGSPSAWGPSSWARRACWTADGPPPTGNSSTSCRRDSPPRGSATKASMCAMDVSGPQPAGLTAGINLALALVEEDHGHAVARSIPAAVSPLIPTYRSSAPHGAFVTTLATGMRSATDHEFPVGGMWGPRYQAHTGP